MTPLIIGNEGGPRISPMTLAYFEDMGVYYPDYRKVPFRSSIVRFCFHCLISNLNTYATQIARTLSRSPESTHLHSLARATKATPTSFAKNRGCAYVDGTLDDYDVALGYRCDPSMASQVRQWPIYFFLYICFDNNVRTFIKRVDERLRRLSLLLLLHD
jgi:hypothetical protein